MKRGEWIMRKITGTPTPATKNRERSVSRESSYYPDCRKNAQCDCKMCIASIHATLDLRPSNSLFSPSPETPLTRGFLTPTPLSKQGKENQWPPNSEQSKNLISTPPRKDGRRVAFSDINSTCNSMVYEDENDVEDEDDVEEETEEDNVKKDCNGSRGVLWRKLVIVFYVLLGDFFMSSYLPGQFKPVFSAEKVRGIAAESMSRRRLSDRLEFVARKMGKIAAPAKISNCTTSESTWRLEKDGLMIHSRCVLYTSLVEEVTVWGFPTQTAGIIGRNSGDRSFIIISGRLLEWFEGRTDNVIHAEGDTWVHGKWTASVVHMDGRTWVLEYKLSVFQGGSLLFQGLVFLKWFAVRVFEEMKANFESILMPKLVALHYHEDFRAPT